MTVDDSRRTLTVNQAAARAGVSRRTIYYWLKAGKVEYVRTASGRLRIFADTLWREPTPAETPTEQVA